MASCCSEYTRAQAAAGRGLPAVEPGQPAPAGTGLSRRTFLAKGLGTALAVYGASKLPLAALDEGIAAAAEAPGQRVLVSVFLSGGADALSVLAPVGDAKYATYRPTLKLAPGAGTTFSEDARLMWHPAAAGIRTLHAEGKVSVMPAVGMPSPDQSHFTSRHFWEVGATDPSGRFGWLGRYLDLHGTADNPIQGLGFGALSPALAAADVPVGAVPSVDDFELWTWGVGNPLLSPMLQSIGRLGALPTADPARRQARLVASQVDSLRAQLAPFQPGVTAPVAYPAGTFGTRLKGLAAVLGAGLPVRAAALEAPGGYDTHSDQAATLTRNLTAVSDGLLAFQRDLEARGLADRVLTLVWSEFGRRAWENGSGTDHGAAGIGFVIGAQAKGTMVGEFPGLATLDAGGNVRHTADFRSVYCSLLEQWYGVDAAPIVPGAAGFARPALVRA